MADIDKILEAEKTITTISKELSKMKSAVELLDSTKTKADAVIRTGETVVENINSFVEKGSALVEKIGDFDIQENLKLLEDKGEELKNGLGILNKEFQDFTGYIDEELQIVLKSNDDLKKHITMLLIIATLFMAFTHYIF
jgi:hypothetical protein